ncbi:TetR family transcriptional regulator [Variovorax ginsengisoli]|uniref:TetR/AcrR family acrAB operon transcriptional repressor n=1 Tax=Variovorax ginsengisoli TaxID=363844 RepID=A0ABT9SAG1_9BURK|nr:TetR family transcriptional regulator [Variovorax ginsengisoli]MDP9900889.1 TetR/AcrR family acrAB operon transcriptional repressor [Variovorax ginsengisoli]
MRHTRAEALLTRARLVDAALAAFCDNGVHATTLGDVAMRAGFTRGAVYWHFANKDALLNEIIAGLQWPLDIGSDLAPYRTHPRPLDRLRRQLWLQIQRCTQDPAQWQRVRLMLRHGAGPDLPVDARMHIEHATSAAISRLVQVMDIAHARGQLRQGLEPATAANCLHSVGIGVLSAHAVDPLQPGQRSTWPLCVDVFMAGLCAAPNG